MESNADVSKVITCPPFDIYFSNSIPIVDDSISVVPATIVSLLARYSLLLGYDDEGRYCGLTLTRCALIFDGDSMSLFLAFAKQ